MSAFHFTFLDGALGYDCIRCQAKCCRGYGFALPAGELVQLLGRAPELAPFLQLRGGAVHAFTLTDGCWALADDGRCGIELGHGREAKPAVCKLFPLQLRRIGGHRVVDLQLLACPLEDARAVPDRPGATVIRHRDILADLDTLDTEAFWGEAPLAAGAPEDIFAHEAAIAAEARALLDAGAVDGDALPLIRATARSGGERLAGLRERWRTFFALDTSGFDQAVARPFALALGPLRMVALTTPGALPWPKLERGMPARLLAGAFLAALSARAGRTPTLRGIAEVWRSTPLVRDALARFDDRVEVAEGKQPAGTPPELATAFAAVVRAAQSGTLGDALIASNCPEALRPLLLRWVSDRI